MQKIKINFLDAIIAFEVNNYSRCNYYDYFERIDKSGCSINIEIIYMNALKLYKTYDVTNIDIEKMSLYLKYILQGSQMMDCLLIPGLGKMEYKNSKLSIELIDGDDKLLVELTKNEIEEFFCQFINEMSRNLNRHPNERNTVYRYCLKEFKPAPKQRDYLSSDEAQSFMENVTSFYRVKYPEMNLYRKENPLDELWPEGIDDVDIDFDLLAWESDFYEYDDYYSLYDDENRIKITKGSHKSSYAVCIETNNDIYIPNDLELENYKYINRFTFGFFEGDIDELKDIDSDSYGFLSVNLLDGIIKINGVLDIKLTDKEIEKIKRDTHLYDFILRTEEKKYLYDSHYNKIEKKIFMQFEVDDNKYTIQFAKQEKEIDYSCLSLFNVCCYFIKRHTTLKEIAMYDLESQKNIKKYRDFYEEYLY